MASTVELSHLPLALPLNEPSFPRACWISEIRSEVGAVCPRSFRWELDFFDDRRDLLPVEDAAGFVVVVLLDAAAAFPHTPEPAARSSVKPTYVAVRRYIEPQFPLWTLN